MSFKAHKMLADPRVIKRVATKVAVDHDYDVPYVAGYSKDGKTIYIDRHFPLKMGKVDIEPYILTHEMTEKALIDIYHLEYQDAHHLATHAEKMHAAKDDLDWKKYSAHCEKYFKPLENERLEKVPVDLDLTPYKD